MTIEEIKNELRRLKKEIQLKWRNIIQLKLENKISKEDVIDYKYNTLIPILDKVTDVSILAVELEKTELYPSIIEFFKNTTELSTYYTRQDNVRMDFNYSQQDEEVLSILLPGFESAVRMLVIGTIAIIEKDFNFISKLGDEDVAWVKTVDGNIIFKSIYYYPWFESGWGAGSLITYFDEALKRISNDKLLKERYFSISVSEPIKYLCQFNLLQALKVEIKNQNDWKDGFPFFPNFARFRFSYVNDLLLEIIHNPTIITNSFGIEEDKIKDFLKIYINFITKDFNMGGLPWLDYLPTSLSKYLKSA